MIIFYIDIFCNDVFYYIEIIFMFLDKFVWGKKFFIEFFLVIFFFGWKIGCEYIN